MTDAWADESIDLQGGLEELVVQGIRSCRPHVGVMAEKSGDERFELDVGCAGGRDDALEVKVEGEKG